MARVKLPILYVMGSWYTCNLGDPLLAEPALDEIRSWYSAPPGKKGASPRGSAYFRHESEGRPHCEVHVYLAPGAEDLAASLGARPCGKPPTEGLGMLAGTDYERPAHNLA